MEIESLQGLFCQQFSSKLKRCGCYCKQPQLLNAKPKTHVALPLKHIDYQIQINNGLASISLQQRYLNPTNKFLDVEFSFPIDPNSSIYKFSAQFSGKRIQGIVKQKQQAKRQFNEAIKQGKQAVYAQLDPNSKDIMNLQIGNIGPLQQVKISVSYLQQLNISLNTFYEFHLCSTISPRYMNNFAGYKFKQNIQHLKGQYTWTFKITLETTRKIIVHQCKSHKMQVLSKNQNQNQMVLVLANQQKPNKDLHFLFTTEDFHLPNYVVGRTDTSSSVMLSFIPKFCQLNVDDAMKASLNNKNLQTDMNGAKGEYIFFLDRSGSMGGARIQKAKQALILFLRSLPQNTYFNVVSFGSSKIKMFDKSQKFDKTTLDRAVKLIQTMRADLGGTQIYDCLQAQLTTKHIQGYPKQLFLLTDGGVSNTEGVIQLVHKNTKYSRCHAIGIGNGCSQALIKGCAQKGKGKYIFIQDIENPSQKIIGLLEETLTPVIDNVKLKYDKNLVESIVPNPESIPYILKNEVVNFYLLLKGQLQKPIQFDFQYKDSVNNIPYKSHIQIKPQFYNVPFVDKMAHSKIIKSLQIAQKDNSPIQQLIYYVKIVDKKQQAIKHSVKHQILSEFTAFICVNMELVDGRYQQIQDKGKQKVNVQSIQLNDYLQRAQILESIQLKSQNQKQPIYLKSQNIKKSLQLKSQYQKKSSSRPQSNICLAEKKSSSNVLGGIGNIFNSVGNSISNGLSGIFSTSKSSIPPQLQIIKRQRQQQSLFMAPKSSLNSAQFKNQIFKKSQKQMDCQQQYQDDCDNQMIQQFLQISAMECQSPPMMPQMNCLHEMKRREKEVQKDRIRYKAKKTEPLILNKQKQKQQKNQKDKKQINTISRQQNSTKAPSKNINQIISQQNTDGSFSSLKLIQLLLSSQSYQKAQQQLKMSGITIKQNQKNILITYLIAKWIQKYHPEKQYALIIKKCFGFVKKIIKLEELNFLDKYVN